MYLLMMVGFAFQNGEGAIKLLDKDESHHLVAESHGRERHFRVGAVVHLLREAVRPADDENQAFRARGHLFFKAFGEIHGSELLAVFVQKNDLVGGLQLAQNQETFGSFLLFLAEGLAVARVGDFLHLERGIMPNPPDIFLDASDEVVFIRFADDQK